VILQFDARCCRALARPGGRVKGSKAMKGIFSSYDEKTGKGTITPKPSGRCLSFAEATGFFLTAKEYRFSIPLADVLQASVKVGGEVEFELSKSKNGKVKILRY
jgi:hypothetical protein